MGSRIASSQGPASKPWRFELVLDQRGVPRRTQLSRALIQEVQRGRLLPGALLPGSRTLATQLKVNRKVVVAAMEELCAQGWLEALPARGMRVAEHLPMLAVADAEGLRRAPVPPKPRPSELPSSIIDDGAPDTRIAPTDELARAHRRALRALSRGGLGYADPAGDPVLREVLSSFVNQARGLSCTPGQVVLTRGSQGALSLYALAMLGAGDVVAVESPGYTPAWRAFELAGAEVIHIPVDESGLDTAALEARARALRGRLKAAYVTPHHQYPTSVSLSAERRMHLQQIAERFDLTIIEDDYDYEYHFDGAPLLPLSAAPRSAHRCVYVASLSKLLAPAIRLGYIVASEPVVARLRQARDVLDRQGDVVLERAISELFEDGVIQRHARRARRLYRARRDHLLGQLQTRAALARAFECSVPSGGLALWLRLRRGAVEPMAWRARGLGVHITPGSAHLHQGHVAAFRFGFAAYTPDELSQICDVLAATCSPTPATR